MWGYLAPLRAPLCGDLLHGLVVLHGLGVHGALLGVRLPGGALSCLRDFVYAVVDCRPAVPLLKKQSVRVCTVCVYICYFSAVSRPKY